MCGKDSNIVPFLLPFQCSNQFPDWVLDRNRSNRRPGDCIFSHTTQSELSFFGVLVSMFFVFLNDFIFILYTEYPMPWETYFLQRWIWARFLEFWNWFDMVVFLFANNERYLIESICFPNILWLDSEHIFVVKY